MGKVNKGLFGGFVCMLFICFVWMWKMIMDLLLGNFRAGPPPNNFNNF